jgi:hypothetical protein
MQYSYQEKMIAKQLKDRACLDEVILTIIISPSHLAHTMDKRTRANGNGEYTATTNDLERKLHKY